MNWTEGALSRHSRRKGWSEEAARQKKYFAKARARLYHDPAPKSTSASSTAKFIPSYIPRSPTASSQTSASSRSRQAKNNPTTDVALGSFNHSERILGNIGSGSSRLSQLGKRDRASTSEHQLTEDHQAPDLDAKRQKLLQRRDWTGVGLQKPPALDFSWKREHSTTATNAVKRQASSRKSGHRTEQPPTSLRKHGKRHEKDFVPPPITDPMRIRVGNQDFRWSVASNSVRSPASNNGRLLTLRDWESQHKTPSLPRGSPCTTCGSSSSSSPNGILYRPSSRVSRLFGERNRQKQSSNDRALEKSSTISNVYSRKQRPSESAQHIVLSSPRMLHHPRPTRGERLPLLQLWSPGPDSAASTVAQASDAVSPNAYIGIDSKRWRDWLHARVEQVVQAASGNKLEPSTSARRLAPHAREDGFDPTPSPYTPVFEDRPDDGGDGDGTAHMQSRHESDFPGSSTAFPLAPSRITGLNGRPTNTLDAHNFSELHPIRSEDHEITQASPKVVSDEPDMDKTPEEVNGPPAAIRKIPKDRDLFSLFEVEEQERASREIVVYSQPNIDAEVDEDEIWKKFVFDEDPSEISRRAFQEAQEQTRRQLSPPPAPLPSDTIEPPSASRNPLVASTGSVRGMGHCSECQSPGTVGISMTSDDNATAALDKIVSSATARSLVTSHPASPSPTCQKREADFRFRQPRQFVGRLAHSTTAAVDGTQEFLTGLHTSGRARRRRRRRDSARPDIRSMPNFEGDPIEESP